MFSYEEIRRLLGGDEAPPRFVIHRRGLIQGLCLRSDFHPRFEANPAEVWISTEEHVLEWGERLAWDSGAMWVFVSSGPGALYRARGIYHVLDSTCERVELARRLVYPGLDGLSRVVFLEKEMSPAECNDPKVMRGSES